MSPDLSLKGGIKSWMREGESKGSLKKRVIYVMTVEINKDHPNENKQAIFSELVVTRELTSITCVWERLKRQAGEWESFIMKKEKKRGTTSGIL